MSEQAPRNELDIQLEALSGEIDELLLDVPPVLDGLGGQNTFNTVKDIQGYELGLSKSEKPDGTLGYHVATAQPIGRTGYIDSWDFHWGDREPTSLYARTHKSWLHLSITDPGDVRKAAPINIVDTEGMIATIIKNYRMSR